MWDMLTNEPTYTLVCILVLMAVFGAIVRGLKNEPGDKATDPFEPEE